MTADERGAGGERVGLPWGDMAYDRKTPAEVVYDYAVTRGDLSEQYARDQLASWIERYALAAVAASLEATCHCGQPVTHGYDGNPGHHRGMCEHCDAVRCDAYPGACREAAEADAAAIVRRGVRRVCVFTMARPEGAA